MRIGFPVNFIHMRGAIIVRPLRHRALVQNHVQQRAVHVQAAMYSMKPNRRNLFMKKLTETEFAPIISEATAIESAQTTASCL